VGQTPGIQFSLLPCSPAAEQTSTFLEGHHEEAFSADH